MASADTALVIYCNHPSWWDPMLAMYMRSRFLPNHHMYAPIDSASLEKYKIFKSMGFYGVSNTHQGASEFLKQSWQLLQTAGSSIWLTPEGRFTDPRQLDVPLQPGLAHLAHAIEKRPSPQHHLTCGLYQPQSSIPFGKSDCRSVSVGSAKLCK